MNKEELINYVETQLPLFDLKEVAVGWTEVFPDGTKDNTLYFTQKHLAVCQVEGTTAYAYVNKGYELLQFKQVFVPILQDIPEDVDGDVTTHEGYASMVVFPHSDMLKLGENSRLGLVIVNSVDLSSSVRVSFCVEEKAGDKTYVHFLPESVGGFKKAHKGNALRVTQDYLKVIGRVSEAWVTMYHKFNAVNIVKECQNPMELEFDTLIEACDIKPRIGNKLRERFLAEQAKFTLLDFFHCWVDEAGRRKFKSGKHQQKYLAKICESIVQQATVLSL